MLIQKQYNKIKFAGNLEEVASIFFILEEVKEIILDFSKRTETVLSTYCVLI